MGIPRQVLLLCLILAVTGIATAWLGWASIEPYVEDEFEWMQSDNHAEWITIAFGCVTIFSVLPVLARFRWSGWAALVTYSCSAGLLITQLPDPFYWWFIEPLLDPNANDPWLPLLEVILSPRTIYFYFAVALALGYCSWLLIVTSRDWFRARPAAPATSSASSHWSGPIITSAIALLIWLLLGGYGPFSIIGQIAYFRFDVHWPFDSIDQAVAFTAAMAVVIVRLNERADVDARGVRITLAPTGWKLFRLPWKRIRRVEVIRRQGRPSSAVIKSFPFTFALHAKRYENGEQLVDAVQIEAKKQGKPLTEWSVYANAPWMAVTLVAWGFMVLVYCQYAQTADWVGFLDTNYPPGNFEAIASPVQYGLLSALAAACFGTGLGVLSAFHHAGVRPALLVLMVVALTYVLPGHLIHWLVWIAIFHIYMAMRGQDPQSIVPHPSVAEWDWGMNLSEYAPVFAAVFYLFAVVLAARKIREDKIVGESVNDAA